MDKHKQLSIFQNLSALQGFLVYGLYSCFTMVHRSYTGINADLYLGGGLFLVLATMIILLFFHLKKMREEILRS